MRSKVAHRAKQFDAGQHKVIAGIKQKFTFLLVPLSPRKNVLISIQLMSFSIAFFGGALLVMMGQQTRSESLFYYFRIEDHVPEDHLLRLVDRHIDFGFIREALKESYSHTGRPSIDPEVLLRVLLIGYLYGIISERRLVEDVGMHLAYRWFTGLGFDQEVPHHSTFSKNRRDRFQECRMSDY